VELVRSSLNLLGTWAGDTELRTTICPSVLDPGDVGDLARHLEGHDRLVLQQFQPGHCLQTELNRLDPYPEELLHELARDCRHYIPTSVRNCRSASAPAS
jgi:hypothetical protein